MQGTGEAWSSSVTWEKRTGCGKNSGRLSHTSGWWACRQRAVTCDLLMEGADKTKPKTDSRTKLVEVEKPRLWVRGGRVHQTEWPCPHCVVNAEAVPAQESRCDCLHTGPVGECPRPAPTVRWLCCSPPLGASPSRHVDRAGPTACFGPGDMAELTQYQRWAWPQGAWPLLLLILESSSSHVNKLGLACWRFLPRPAGPPA